MYERNIFSYEWDEKIRYTCSHGSKVFLKRIFWKNDTAMSLQTQVLLWYFQRCFHHLGRPHNIVTASGLELNYLLRKFGRRATDILSDDRQRWQYYGYEWCSSNHKGGSAIFIEQQESISKVFESLINPKSSASPVKEECKKISSWLTFLPADQRQT